MPKSNRFGKATVLSPEQLQQLWAKMEQPWAIAAQIAYFTAARAGEVLKLRGEDIANNAIVYRAVNTKAKKTREIEIVLQLRQLVQQENLPQTGYLFTGGGKTGHLTVREFDKSSSLARTNSRFSNHPFRHYQTLMVPAL